MRKLSKVNIVLLKEVFDEKLSNRFLDATKRNRLLTHKLALFGFLSLSTEIKWFNMIYIIVLVLIDNRFSNFKSKKNLQNATFLILLKSRQITAYKVLCQTHNSNGM